MTTAGVRVGGANLPIEYRVGVGVTFGLTLNQTVASVTSPYPWAGATITHDIVNQSGSSIASNLTVTTGADGAATIAVAPADAIGGSYFYWIEVTKAGVGTSLFAGTLVGKQPWEPCTSTVDQTFTIPQAGAVTLTLAVSGPTMAANVPLADVGGFYTTDNVEAALQQLGAGIEPGPSVVIPPASTLVTPVAAAWFGINQTLGNRCFVPVAKSYRFVNWYCSVQSGNIQVCVVRLNGLAYTRVMNSGIIACPAVGAVKTDLGATALAAGDYAVCFWADNTTVQVANGNAQVQWAAAEMSVNFGSPAGAIPASGTATYSARILHAFMLSIS